MVSRGSPPRIPRSFSSLRLAWQGMQRFTTSFWAMSLVFTTRAALGIWGLAMAGFLAHASWRDPGPWQASQPTAISDHVVWNVSLSGS